MNVIFHYIISINYDKLISAKKYAQILLRIDKNKL